MGIALVGIILSVVLLSAPAIALSRLRSGSRGWLAYLLSVVLGLPLAGWWLSLLSGIDLRVPGDSGDGWTTRTSVVPCGASAGLGAVFFGIGERLRGRDRTG